MLTKDVGIGVKNMKAIENQETKFLSNIVSKK
jgi:hypothetical protein